MNTQSQINTEMQEIVFNPYKPFTINGMLADEERTAAVALSITSSPASNNIWKQIFSRMPSDIFVDICSRIEPKTQQYISAVYSLDPCKAAERIIERASSLDIRVLTYWENDYPPMLREIQWPPIVLYVMGQIIAKPSVAVVGTRKADARSSAHSRRIARDLAINGFIVVSGMAIGIDREAHLGALEATGATIGVLANGIDIVYPSPNRDLYNMIKAAPNSALISEYPPGIRAGIWTFVRRNRIISGLGTGTVVVKAGMQSGALITARHALEQNRDVFACAGNSFDEEYAGCNHLIRNGAILVTRSEDIIYELSRYTMPNIAINGDKIMMPHADCVNSEKNGNIVYGSESLECGILKILSNRESDIDSLIRQMESSPAAVHEALIILEFDGRIVRKGNVISLL